MGRNKTFSHKVTLSERRLRNKRVNDVRKKAVSDKDITKVYNMYYRDQVRALYNAVYNAR
jgi:hypothetical protein